MTSWASWSGATAASVHPPFEPARSAQVQVVGAFGSGWRFHTRHRGLSSNACGPLHVSSADDRCRATVVRKFDESQQSNRGRNPQMARRCIADSPHKARIDVMPQYQTLPHPRQPREDLRQLPPIRLAGGPSYTQPGLPQPGKARLGRGGSRGYWARGTTGGPLRWFPCPGGQDWARSLGPSAR